MVRSLLIGIVLLALTARLDAAGNVVDRPDHADLIYDPATGNVTLDATSRGGRLFSIYFENAEGAFRPENARFPFLFVGTNITDTEFAIGQTSPLPGGIETFNVFDMGPIFPAGFQSSEELSQFLAEASYRDEIGPELPEFDLIVVPEPSGFTSAIVIPAACLLALRGRRRRIRNRFHDSSVSGGSDQYCHDRKRNLSVRLRSDNDRQVERRRQSVCIFGTRNQAFEVRCR